MPQAERESKTVLWQLLIGCAVIFVTLLVQILCIGSAIVVLRRLGIWMASSWSVLRFVSVLACVVLPVVAGVALCTSIWTATFMRLGLFDSAERAAYFSIVTFTTLGYGDITLDPQWRFLSGLTATNGLIVFGLNTAFLVEVFSRLGHAEKARGSETHGKE